MYKYCLGLVPWVFCTLHVLILDLDELVALHE